MMHSRSLSLLILLTVAAHSYGQTVTPRAVIVGPPNKDESVWKKLYPAPSDFAELKKRFPADKYLLLEKDGRWLYVFDRDLPALRHKVSKELVVRAFLEKADARGVVRFGDLPSEVKAAALHLFSGSAIDIQRMGAQADNIKIALEANFWLEGKSAERTIGTEILPMSESKERRALGDDLREHGVHKYVMGPEELGAYQREYIERSRREAGVSARYVRVHELNRQSALKAALEALELHLKEGERSATMYDAVFKKILGKALDEISGTPLRESLELSQLPQRFFRSYQGAVRFNPGSYGLNGEQAAESFLNTITGYRLGISLNMYYAEAPQEPVDGKRPPGAFHSVVLFRS